LVIGWAAENESTFSCDGALGAAFVLIDTFAARLATLENFSKARR
jgi:hypothetical protein